MVARLIELPARLAICQLPLLVLERAGLTRRGRLVPSSWLVVDGAV